jgi:hypothetical protein
MESVSFEVFIPDEKKVRISTNGVVLIMLLALFVISWLDKESVVLPTIFVFIVIFSIWALLAQETIEG